MARGVSRLASEKSQLVGREKLETLPYLSEGNKQQVGEELTPCGLRRRCFAALTVERV